MTKRKLASLLLTASSITSGLMDINGLVPEDKRKFTTTIAVVCGILARSPLLKEDKVKEEEKDNDYE